MHAFRHSSTPSSTTAAPKEQGEEEEGESSKSMTMGEKCDKEKEKNSTEEDKEGNDDGKEDEKEEEVYSTDKEEEGDKGKKEENGGEEESESKRPIKRVEWEKQALRFEMMFKVNEVEPFHVLVEDKAGTMWRESQENVKSVKFKVVFLRVLVEGSAGASWMRLIDKDDPGLEGSQSPFLSPAPSCSTAPISSLTAMKAHPSKILPSSYSLMACSCLLLLPASSCS
ncbi:unnamed protein product [Closterium sp. Naga37s-1]|nr:unnamed protein product [Closterium sp. Naga37s-1]CAI5520573.1 unnamed protein product [Closterium sp. Naga37s-1]CAI5520575.1 unnamed protein product [Closterium sp. Naga37s-1]